jgi:hypothetical protein
MRTGSKGKGHYEANKKSKWWIFYKSNKTLIKSEYENNQLNGFSLIYKKTV